MKKTFLEQFEALNSLSFKIVDLVGVIAEYQALSEEVVDRHFEVCALIMHVLKSNKMSWIEKMVILCLIEQHTTHDGKYGYTEQQLLNILNIPQQEFQKYFSKNYGMFIEKAVMADGAILYSFTADYMPEQLEFFREQSSEE